MLMLLMMNALTITVSSSEDAPNSKFAFATCITFRIIVFTSE